MKRQTKTKEHLINELAEMRQRIAELEKADTERKRAEEALRYEKDLVQKYLDVARVMLVVIDADEKVSLINRKGCETLGYEEKEIIGKSWFDIFIPERMRTEIRGVFAKLMAGEIEPVEYFENPVLTKSGEERIIAWYNTVLRDDAGNISGTISSGEDITERKRAEEKIEHLNTVLRAIRNVNQLIATEKDSKRMIKGACVELVETRGYFNAWIALLDESSMLVSTAEAGLGKDFTPIVEMLKRGELTACGRRALKQSGVIIIEEPLSTCIDCPLAHKYGDGGAMTVRLEYGGKVYGLMSVSMPRDLTADEEEQTLFREVAGDIALALHNINLEEERKLAEEALEESEEKYRTILEDIEDGYFEVDIAGNFTFFNDPMCGIIGHSRDEMMGMNNRQYHDKETAKKVFKAFNRVYTTGKPIKEFGWALIRKDGTKRFIEASVSLKRNSEGEAIGFRGIIRDITERKEAEEALRKSEKHYRLLAENVTDVIWTMDMNLQMTYISPSVTRLQGYSVEEALAINWEENLTPASIEAATKIIEEEMAMEEMEQKDLSRSRTLEVEQYRKDGSIVRSELEMTFLRDPDGQPVEILGVSRDITERKRAEEERERSAKRLQALHSITQAVSHSLDMDEMLNQSLDRVLEVMDNDVGGIYLADLQAGILSLKVHSGMSDEYVNSVDLIKLEEEEVKRAIEQKEPVLELDKVFSEANTARIAAAMEKEGLQDYITVPLWSRGVPLGALVIADRRERQFSTDELDLLSAIGNEIAVGIENATLLERTRELSITDELTGLHNRRHFYQVLESEQYRTKRYGRSFSLAMLDLDGFKEYNDRFGHTSGDGVLQSFAQTLKAALRKSDISFRYGGDEFTVILPATDTNRAKQIIDRTRAKWLQTAEAQYPAVEPPLGFSAGIAQFPKDAETGDGLVFLADSALYFAKREGGYRAVLVSDLSAIPPDVLSAATLDQIYALAATVDARDPFTYGHSGRVADIAQTIGKATGLVEKELADLYAASLLHDVGKVGVPDAVLTKPDVLTEEEWEIIKKHSAEGARIAGYIKGLGAVVPVIKHHHEWYDGTGYPDGLKGEEIPLGARIISVADAYDTMTTARPYREVVSQQEALEELRRYSGTQFDPELVEAFCRAMNEDKGKVNKRKPSPK